MNKRGRLISMKRIGINCLSFESKHRCGAEEVLYNLCRGFWELEVEAKLVFFCYDYMKSIIEKIYPKAEFVIFKDDLSPKHKFLNILKVQTFQFYKIYKKYDLDLIFFPQCGVGLLKYNIPIIVLPHDIQNVSKPENFKNLKFNSIRYMFFKWFYHNDFRIANRVIAISQIDKQEIIRCYPQYEYKIELIYNPIFIKNLSNIDYDKCNYILATNIQYEHKNIITLIKAFEIFLETKPEYELFLVGKESHHTEKLKQYVVEKKLEEKIHFTGFITRDELEKIWKKTRLYVNPSLYEGFGMTSVESIILGAPTLLSNIDVNREVTEGLCNYYDDIRSESNLAKSMLEIVGRQIEQNVLENNRIRLVEKYNYKSISNKYWDIMQELIN